MSDHAKSLADALRLLADALEREVDNGIALVSDHTGNQLVANAREALAAYDAATKPSALTDHPSDHHGNSASWEDM